MTLEQPVRGLSDEGSAGLEALGRRALGAEPEALAAADGSADRLRPAGYRQVFALCLLNAGPVVQGLGLWVLAPLISVSIGTGMGRGPSLFSFQHELEAVGAVAGALAVVAFSHRWRHASRSRLVLWIAAAGGVILALGSVVITANWLLVGALLLGSACAGAGETLQRPLLFESYGARLRLRAYCAQAAAIATASAVLWCVVVVGEFSLNWTWRPVLLLLGVAVLVATALAHRLRDPGIGALDAKVIATAARSSHGLTDADAESSETAGGAGIFQRIRQVGTVAGARAALLLLLVFGVFIVPVQSYLAFFLEDRWGVARRGAGFLMVALFAGALPVLWALARYRSTGVDAKGQLLRVGGLAAVLTGVALALVATIPNYAAMIIALFFVYAAVFVVLPTAWTVLFSVVHPGHRNAAGALAASVIAAGALLGPSFASAFFTRFGTKWALLSLAAVCCGLGASTMRRSAVAPADVDRVIGVVVAQEEHRALQATGHHFPLLACRDLDFCYGVIQVLFGVSLTVEDGEMVALLGTNGAGKSTLLRAICGLGYPTGGTVHFAGADVTDTPAAARVALGITQVPGGRAVFGPLSVVENLRVYGYSLGRRRAALDRGIDAAFDAFPRLGERRNQQASSLSGGEQQMLGLSKALMLKPKLLAIDELSLGLAPIVTASLLDMVRRINAEGTAVLLIEQSVNVALSLVDHAYFMEKGAVRFNGTATDLIERDDLLRAVFLRAADT
jgi:ABC-type branched-subunit amino acid transport system ATPase component